MNDVKNWPKNFDPHDVNLKKQLHDLADEKNFIDLRRDRPILVCGAKKKKGPGFCKSIAGSGTNHPGYGRCKYCGGLNTGPKTAAGKERSKMNGRKHGFYSSVLTPAERDTYETLLEQKIVGLQDEIFMLKAKILSYLQKKNLFEIGAGRPETVYYKDGEEQAFYRAGTIEDKPLTRALETLRRLVDSHAKLTENSSDSLVESINKELQAASQGQVTLSWGTPPQQRKEQ